MNFTTPMAGLLALAAIPIVIVYFLKLRRPRRTVPSLVLWQKVLEDQRVNSPFQRFRRNLLLWLQLALLACLVLACMQPFFGSSFGSGDALPIIVDVSASMDAREEPGGQSRLERVQDELYELVDSLPRSKRVALIASGARATQLTDVTSDRSLLRAAITKLTIEPVETDLTPALRLAEGLTQSTRVSELRLYTDGNMPTDANSPDGVAVVPFDLPFEVDYRHIEDRKPAGNIGLVEVSASRSGESDWDIFARVTASVTAGRADVILEQDGQELRRDAAVFEAGTSQRLSFSLDSTSASNVVVRVEPKQFDALQLDDRVRLDLPAARPLALSIDSSLSAFRFAADGLENRRFVDTAADLEITTNADSTATVSLVVETIPEELKEFLEYRDGHSDIVDWQRSDPLLRHVQLSDVQFLVHPAYIDGAGRKEIEEAGYRIVAETADGPLVVRRDNGRRLTYGLLFDPDRSTLPFRIGFPVMVANAADLATARAELADVRGITAGVLPPTNVGRDGEYTVDRPSGKSQTVKAANGGVLRGIVVDELGDYVIRRGGEDVRTFGVSLLSSVESGLIGVDEVRFSDVTVEAGTEEPQGDQSIWRWLAAAALALLVFEWWYAHRPVVVASHTNRPRRPQSVASQKRPQPVSQ